MMTERYYETGGLVFCLRSPDFADLAHLAAFRCAPCGADDVCTVETAETVPMPDGEKLWGDSYTDYLRTADGIVRVVTDERGGGLLMTDTPTADGHRILLREKWAGSLHAAFALRMMDIPHRVLRFGGIFLHASFIDVGGEAVLFTAHKQVGKSTQARLWQTLRGAETVNGDRALLRRINGRICACGSPYCGTSDICGNRILPLKAVVVLSQAPENRAEKAGPRQAFRALMSGCSFNTWDPGQVNAATAICGGIVTEVPFYTLACRPDEGAVEALEKLL